MHEKHIVILDDNAFHERRLIDELKMRGYKATVATSTDELFKIVKESENIDLYILDVLLDEEYVSFGGEKYSTSHGCDTGVIVARLLRHSNIDTPIIFNSVAFYSEDVNRIKEYVNGDPNAAYFQKRGLVNLKSLPDYIDELFEKWKISKSKWKEVLGEAIVLKPGMFGIGVDLKKLFNK